MDKSKDKTASQHAAVGAVPGGWKLVPLEPTGEMIGIAHHEWDNGATQKEIWRAMLRVAPSDAKDEQGEPTTGIRADISADRQFMAGVSLGWNFGVALDAKGYRACIEGRSEQIREALATLPRASDAPATPTDCPHAAPFRYCPECTVSPCPIGLGGKK